jgi:L-ascorbate metabolism protein UlaG (beta-lactamase superfamily)
MIKKIFKYMIITIVLVIAVLIGGGLLFIKLSPEFGGKASQKDIEHYKELGRFKKGVFENETYTTMDMSFSSIVSTSIQFIKGVPNAKPNKSLDMKTIDSLSVVKNTDRTRLIWFGHSAFLLQIEGKNILIDPMLGDVPAPHPMLGGNRYNRTLPIEIEKLPKRDAIIISHDHYYHLDYNSIKKLKLKTESFYVPLGVGAHFKAWGIESKLIHELNWWDEIDMDNLKFILTPSRHFSGRGIQDKNKTLWGSWIVQGKKDNIYFSGDGGYGPHFKKIGKKYGPFDFAMMECGQYNEKWHDIHMMPEETAKATKDVNAKIMMPIHWGAFTLSLHSWTDPVERVSKKLKELNQDYIIPKIGESIWLDKPVVENSEWWKEN